MFKVGRRPCVSSLSILEALRLAAVPSTEPALLGNVILQNLHGSARTHTPGISGPTCRAREGRKQWVSEKPFIAAGAQVRSF